jgi:hypothetical protein
LDWIKFLFLTSLLGAGFDALALDVNGMGDRHPSLQALYQFKETSGPALDSSGVGTPLNLEFTDPDAVLRNVGSINIKRDTMIRSQGNADKIINACNASKAITIEMWVENNRTALPPEGFGDPVPLPMVAFGTATKTDFKFSQFYDSGDLYQLQSSYSDLMTPAKSAEIGLLQHIYYTQASDGWAKIYVGDASRVLPRVTLKSTKSVALPANSLLTVGSTPQYSPTGPTLESFSWKGRMYMLAVYCDGLTDDYIMGHLLPRTSYLAFTPSVNSPITPAQERAALLYKRLTGVKTPIDNPILGQMAQKIESGDVKGAAKLATGETGFYNITVRDFASRMSTRDETVNAGLNDMVATFIGVARDDISAQELLTGNYSYVGDPAKTAVDNDLIKDFLKSNNHYDQLDKLGYDLSAVLVKRDQQKLYNGKGGVVDNPDPAGVLTSRAFLAAHAVAGTNRRIVEFTFREFLCVPMQLWADATGPDAMIGRDIDRFPAGDNQKFRVTCRSCHSNMDGLRPAAARLDFSAGYVKHALVVASGTGGDDDEATMAQNPAGIAAKYNQNENVFPGGNIVRDTRFNNYANRGLNASYFGWKGELTGVGMHDFGKMISLADAFPRCMAKRAYRSVCKREPASFDQDMINKVAKDFADNGYKLRDLFENVAISPECLGR